MLLAELLDQTVAALVERDVLDLVSEDGCELIFRVDVRQNSCPDEDLSAGQAERTLEARAGIEVKLVGKFPLGVHRDAVSHSLQIFVELLGLRGRGHALFLRELVGQNLAESNLLGVGQADRSCGRLGGGRLQQRHQARQQREQILHGFFQGSRLSASRSGTGASELLKVTSLLLWTWRSLVG